MRSELENEMLALELVNDRIKLKGNLHEVCNIKQTKGSFCHHFRRKIKLKI